MKPGGSDTDTVGSEATVVVAAGLSFQAAPTTLPLPRPEALKPLTAKAVTCATNPTFTGRLTVEMTDAGFTRARDLLV